MIGRTFRGCFDVEGQTPPTVLGGMVQQLAHRNEGHGGSPRVASSRGCLWASIVPDSSDAVQPIARRGPSTRSAASTSSMCHAACARPRRFAPLDRQRRERALVLDPSMLALRRLSSIAMSSPGYIAQVQAQGDHARSAPCHRWMISSEHERLDVAAAEGSGLIASGKERLVLTAPPAPPAPARPRRRSFSISKAA